MKQPMRQPWNPEEIARLFQHAGEIALRYYDAPETAVKADQTVVTAADRAIEAWFTENLDHPEENFRLIGEESIALREESYVKTALTQGYTYVLDPIDGTAPYTVKLPVWAISLGVMHDGVLQEGGVYLVCEDTLLLTAGNGIRIYHPQSDPQLKRWEKFTPRACPLASAGHIGLGQTLAHQWKFDGKNQLFAWSGCVSALCWLLFGRFFAYAGDFKLWDVGGILPLLQKAGYVILSMDECKRELSGDLADNMFELAPGTNRWRVKAPIVAAKTREDAEQVMKQFHRINGN